MTSRTWLFVPGSTPGRFAKAVASGAEQVVVDLEDAVDPGAKVEAREAVVTWLAGGGTGWVRINGATTPWGEGDLGTLVGLEGLAGVVVPKAEDPTELERVAEALGRPVVALVETALGLTRAHEIARASGVKALAFGSIDFALDITAAHDHGALLLARSTLVIASRAHGLMAPIDGVTTALRDPAVTETDARRAKSLGFGGKLCIHPDQLDAVVRGFAPTADELSWARGVLGAADGAVGAVVGPDGAMLDKPVLERARAIVHSAEALQGEGQA